MDWLFLMFPPPILVFQIILVSLLIIFKVCFVEGVFEMSWLFQIDVLGMRFIWQFLSFLIDFIRRRS